MLNGVIVNRASRVANPDASSHAMPSPRHAHSLNLCLLLGAFLNQLVPSTRRICSIWAMPSINSIAFCSACFCVFYSTTLCFLHSLIWIARWHLGLMPSTRQVIRYLGRCPCSKARASSSRRWSVFLAVLCSVVVWVIAILRCSVPGQVRMHWMCMCACAKRKRKHFGRCLHLVDART